MGGGNFRPHPARRHPLVRWLGSRGPRHATRHSGLGRRRVAGPGTASKLPARPQRPAGCGPRGGAHIHLLALEKRRRTDEQLGGAGTDEGSPAAALLGLHAGPHDVCHPLQHGPGGLSHRAIRHRDFRQPLCGRQHADHDPRGYGRVWGNRKIRRLCEMPALSGMPTRIRGEGRHLAVQPREHLHNPLPRGAPDHELRLGIRRQCAVGKKMLRPAHRLGHGARRGVDGRAHARAGREIARRTENLCHGRIPQRLREDELCHDGAPAGHARGGLGNQLRGRRHRLDQARR